MKIRIVEVLKFEYKWGFITLCYTEFLLWCLYHIKIFGWQGSWLFSFQELSNNLVLENVLLYLWHNLLVSKFFDKLFPLSPLSVQEMLTGQRLCQSSSHNDAVLAALNQQRSDGVLCDITLIAEEQKFHAHKAVLAACSDYFRVSPNNSFPVFIIIFRIMLGYGGQEWW